MWWRVFERGLELRGFGKRLERGKLGKRPGKLGKRLELCDFGQRFCKFRTCV